MKSIIILIISFGNINLFSFSGPHYKSDGGLLIDFDIDYGKIFNTNNSLVYFNMTISPFQSKRGSFNIGTSAIFSSDINIFDLYTNIGMTIYPFKEVLSFTFGYGIGGSIYALFNHFPYILTAKMNFDIPIYKNNYITIGSGVLHRNAIKMIGYINSKNYYGIYNGYFFEIGYRLRI